MWLLTIMIWYGTQGLDAFTKELPSERLCHTVGASYQTMKSGAGWPHNVTHVQYQCIKLE